MLDYKKYKELLYTLTDTELKLYLLMYFYNMEDDKKYYPILVSNIKSLANTIGTTVTDINLSINKLVREKYLIKRSDNQAIKCT